MTTQVKTKVTTGQGYEIDVVVKVEYNKHYAEKSNRYGVEIISIKVIADLENTCDSHLGTVDILPVLKATGHYYDGGFEEEINELILQDTKACMIINASEL